MNSIEKITNRIKTLNEKGLEKLSILVGVLESSEEYLKTTSDERIEEIKKARQQENEKDNDRRHNKEIEMESERVSVLNNNKRLFDLINKVDPGNYDLTMNEVIAISTVHNGNAINSSYDYFRYGFLKGQRAFKANKGVR